MDTILENARKHKLFIATPMYGGNANVQFINSLAELTYFFGKHNIYYEFHTIWNEALITRGRNNLVKKFLNSDCDILLFIDSDIGFNFQNIFEMVNVIHTEEDKKIVCGVYPKKGINWNNIYNAYKANYIDTPSDAIRYSSHFVLNFHPTEDEHTVFRLDKPVKVHEAGTGFMMVHREVFDKFKEAYPEQHSIEPESGEDLFYYFDCKIDPETKYYLSEDYMFCQYADKIGYSTWILPWINLSHNGTYTFAGSFAEDTAMYYELNVANKEKND